MHKPALPNPFDLPARDYVRIVMVETTHSGNIGAVARAMKNMGLGNLWLVNPSSFPDETSYARSAGASDVLDRARVVATLEEAVEDCVLVMGTSARGRKVPWPVMSPPDAARRVGEYHGKGQVALVFGRESSGLSNEELQRCQVHVHIPTNPDYSSLNVAMAVQVMCYEIRMECLRGLENPGDNPQLRAIAGPDDEGWDVPPATAAELEGFFVHLETTLKEINFHRQDKSRQLMTRLRRLYHRARPDQLEVNILRGILTAVQKSTSATSRGEGKRKQDQTDV